MAIIFFHLLQHLSLVAWKIAIKVTAALGEMIIITISILLINYIVYYTNT